MSSARGRRGSRWRGREAVGALVLSAVLAASCAVDSSGVIRASGDDEPAIVVADDLSAGECAELLTRLQDRATELVGPDGFIGVGLQDERNPLIRGRFVEVGRFGGQATSASVSVGEPVVAVDGLLAVVRDGRLYLFGDDGIARGSVWLDALPQRRFPLPETGLLPRDGEIVAVSPAVGLTDETGDGYAATVIQRIDISDPSAPTIVERLSVRGDVAGAAGSGDDVQVAVSVPPPALDFLYASTAGGEDAATAHNRELLSTTTLEDWLGAYELTVPDPDGDATTTKGLLGGCSVVAAEGADAALGATVLIDVGTNGGLADLDATTVLGQGRVSFGSEAIYVLSPRSHAVGFAEPGQPGAQRVIISRIVERDNGPEIDGIGIMPGTISHLPSPSLDDGSVMVFTSTLDQFGNGGFEARSLRTADGEIREIDSITLPVQPWDSFTLETVGDDLLLSGQQGSALIDVSDPADLAVTGVEARWDEGEFLGPPQLAPYGEGRVLSVDPGPVTQQFGGVDNFVENLGFGEFGFGWEPWNELQSEASIRIIEGDPLNGDVVAAYQAPVFALWPISSDPSEDEIVVGVIALRGDEGESFDGALLLRREGEELVEAARWALDAPDVEDFGATECDEVEIEGTLLDVMGLWNQTPLRCDDGVPGGMVGHTCVAMAIPDLSPQDLRNWFGFDSPEALTELDEMSAAVASGSSFQGCTPRQAGVPTVARGFIDGDDGGGWLIGTAAVHRVDAGGTVSASLPVEPPYTI